MGAGSGFFQLAGTGNKHIYYVLKLYWWNWEHFILNVFLFQIIFSVGDYYDTLNLLLCCTSKSHMDSDVAYVEAKIPCLLLCHQKIV
jgi:hypothetical protein